MQDQAPTCLLMIVGAPLGAKLGMKFTVILNDGYEQPHGGCQDKSVGQTDIGLRSKSSLHVPVLTCKKQKSTM